MAVLRGDRPDGRVITGSAVARFAGQNKTSPLPRLVIDNKRANQR
jgi:hypothetical protein